MQDLRLQFGKEGGSVKEFEVARVARTSAVVSGSWDRRGELLKSRAKPSRPGVPRQGEAVDNRERASAQRESQMIGRAVAGDADALAEVFGRDRQKLLRVALLLMRNKEDAEDALQEGLLSAYSNLRTFEGRSRFSTWLTRIVLNAALMERRKQQARQRLCLQSSEETEQQLFFRATDTRPDPERACASAETRNLLEDRVKQLPPLLRSAFCLRDIQQLSASEASKVTRVKLSAIKSRTVRARHRLADLLQMKGIRY